MDDTDNQSSSCSYLGHYCLYCSCNDLMIIITNFSLTICRVVLDKLVKKFMLS